MIATLARRLLGLLGTLLVIAVVSFALVRAAPGGPFDDERAVHPSVLAELEARYGMRDPAPVQLFRWLLRLAQGDLGPSFKYRGRSVGEVLWAGAPASFAVGIVALEISVLGGIALGAFAAAREGSRWDRAIRAGASALTAIPSFLTAALLAASLGVGLRLFPVSGMESWRHLVLPSIALALPHLAAVARLTRASLLETLDQDFVRTARAKGLAETTVVLRHALPPALAPVVQYLGPAAAGLVTGSLAVEAVFNVPGVGAHFVNAALNRDYGLVMGTVLVYSALLLVLNALADAAAEALDPRTRDAAEAGRA